MMILNRPTDITQTLVAGFLLLAAAGSLAVAWGYQLITGDMPCELCLEQRIPYYAGVGIALIALLAALNRGPAVVARGMLVLFAILMLYGMTVAIYHAGVEWHFWPGPETCTGGADTTPQSATDLLAKMNEANTTPVVRCDQPNFRFLGLSFAGWNVPASLFLAVVALYGALRRADWW